MWAIPPLVALIGCVSLSAADPARVGDLGLVDAIPPITFGCLGVLTGGFAVAVNRSPRVPLLLAAYVVVFVVLLHGAPAFVEREPRFPTAWLHAGFADYIAHTGRTLPDLDARFNWPGFFAASGLLTRALGLGDPLPLLRWAPLAFELAALAPVYLIAAATSDDARTPWLATWLFVPANWVGQDYFSPQALGFVLFLAFIVLVLRYFPRTGETPRFARWTRQVAHAPDHCPAQVDGSARVPAAGGLFALLLLIYCAVVWSHQLTPYFVIAAMAALVVLGACRLRTMPLLLAVIATAFVSYLAVPYWAGHLNDIFGAVGNVGSTLSANVAGRVSGSASHEWVERLRIMMSLAVLALAFAGAAVRWRRHTSSVVLLGLVATPYSVLGLQSYGGEAIFRSYMFSLPFAAALMAAALSAPLRRYGSSASAAAVVLISSLLIAGFFVARFGNEAFEMVRPGEATALRHLYRVAPPGATFASIDADVPWRYTGIASFRYAQVAIGRRSPEAFVTRTADVLGSNPRGGYLVITRGQIESARLTLGVPARWIAGLYRSLAAAGRFTLAYSNRDALLYRFIGDGGSLPTHAGP